MKVPFVSLSAQYQSIKGSIDKAIADVIADTAFIGGKPVEKFEKEFAEKTGIPYVVSCGNGTDSLYVIMKVLGIGSGDEVITPANSWISSSETITQTGARVVFADVDSRYYTLDPEHVLSKLTSKTKAIMAVHLFGQACDMVALKKICDERSLFLIEDCAQAHLTKYHHQIAGSLGHASSFSFYPGKNLGAYGDAGCMATPDKQLAAKMKMFARHGALVKHQHQIEGINSRMDGLQAAILSAKLPHLEEWTLKRIHHAEQYHRLLHGLPGITVPAVRPETIHTFHLYVIRTTRREELAAYLKEKNIETAIHYPRILPHLEAYRYLKHAQGDFPVAESLEKEILSLPMYPEMTNEMIAHVAASIKEFVEKR